MNPSLHSSPSIEKFKLNLNKQAEPQQTTYANYPIFSIFIL